MKQNGNLYVPIILAIIVESIILAITLPYSTEHTGGAIMAILHMPTIVITGFIADLLFPNSKPGSTIELALIILPQVLFYFYIFLKLSTFFNKK